MPATARVNVVLPGRGAAVAPDITRGPDRGVVTDADRSESAHNTVDVVDLHLSHIGTYSLGHPLLNVQATPASVRAIARAESRAGPTISDQSICVLRG
jgi:hypothetical protein